MDRRYEVNKSRTRTFAHAALKSREGWICGVCAGLGFKFGIEPAILRVITIVGLIVFTYTTIIAYLLLWLLFFRN